MMANLSPATRLWLENGLLFLIWQATDAYTTVLFTRRGGGEGNPLMVNVVHSLKRMLFIKGVGTMLMLVSLWFSLQRHPAYGLNLAYMTHGIMITVLYLNSMAIVRLRREARLPVQEMTVVVPQEVHAWITALGLRTHAQGADHEAGRLLTRFYEFMKEQQNDALTPPLPPFERRIL